MVAILITSVEMKSTEVAEIVTPDKDEVPLEGSGVVVNVESSTVASSSEDIDVGVVLTIKSVTSESTGTVVLVGGELVWVISPPVLDISTPEPSLGSSTNV